MGATSMRWAVVGAGAFILIALACVAVVFNGDSAATTAVREEAGPHDDPAIVYRSFANAAVKGFAQAREAMNEATRRENAAKAGMEQAQSALHDATASAAKVNQLSKASADKAAVVMAKVQAVVDAVKTKAAANTATMQLAYHQLRKERRVKLRAKIHADASKFVDLEAKKAAATAVEAVAAAAVLNVQEAEDSE